MKSKVVARFLGRENFLLKGETDHQTPKAVIGKIKIQVRVKKSSL